MHYALYNDRVIAEYRASVSTILDPCVNQRDSAFHDDPTAAREHISPEAK